MPPTPEASPERLKKLGLVHVRQEELRALTNRVKGILGSLSDSTFLRDPLNPWVIDGQRVMDYANELRACLRTGNELREQINNLKADLGID